MITWIHLTGSVKRNYTLLQNRRGRWFGHPFWRHWGVISRNLLIKSRNQNIFEKFKLNRHLQRIPFKMMYNMSMLRYRFSNERWAGGGAPWTIFLSYSVKVCKVCSLNFEPPADFPWINAIPTQLWLFHVKIRSSWHNLAQNCPVSERHWLN